MNATAKSYVEVTDPAISTREAFILAKAIVNETFRDEDLKEEFDAKANVHYLRSEQKPMPGSRYLSDNENEARIVENGIVGETNPEILDIGVYNGCSAFCLAAIRANGASEFSMSGSTLKLAAPMLVEKRIPVDAQGHADYVTMINAIIDAGKAGEFCPGTMNVSDKLLSTYWVLRRLITCTMREFANIARSPREQLKFDATGLFLSEGGNGPDGSIDRTTGMYIDMQSGEVRDTVIIDEDLTVPMSEIEGSAMAFYEAATTGRAAKLLEAARKFAPIDTTVINRRKVSTPRDLNFPVGVQVTQTNGVWDPELLLSWSQLVCNVAIIQTVEGKWVEKDADLLDF